MLKVHTSAREPALLCESKGAASRKRVRRQGSSGYGTPNFPRALFVSLHRPFWRAGLSKVTACASRPRGERAGVLFFKSPPPVGPSLTRDQLS